MTSVNAASAIELSANISPAKPIVDKKIDIISILGFVISPTFSTCEKAINNTTIYKIALIQKMKCQLDAEIITPDNVGPSAGPAVITSPIMPMTAPRFSIGKINISTVTIIGNKIPVPNACIIRPNNNKPKLGASAPTITPNKDNNMK